MILLIWSACIDHNDLPAPASLDTELHCWSGNWQGRSRDAASLNTPGKVLPTVDSDFFPNIEQLFKIACTLAVTSWEYEGSISRLHLLNTGVGSRGAGGLQPP